MQKLRTIVLAAGKGVRMKSSTPKVLHPLCGRPMIDYVLDVARALRSLKIYVIAGHQKEKLIRQLDKDITVVWQKALLGTADAVKRCASLFSSYKGDVLILSGDTPLLQAATIKRLVGRHRREKAVCTILTAREDNPFGYGRIIRDGKGNIIAIREEKDATIKEKAVREVNTGVYCFRSKELFAAVKKVKRNKKKGEYYLTDVIALLAEQGGKVISSPVSDRREGIGINSRYQLAEASAVMRERINRRFMDDGVTIVDPKTTYIDWNVRIGKDTVIRPCCVIERDVRIGCNCIIGPFAHIRPGSVIGDNTEVGNHTEVSRSRIGPNCFVKHFSFIGDSELGKDVNIGAGVVTANFDGVEKHKTVIKDKAFIGSDSILVAPTVIGKGAKTGAGSVVTKKRVADKEIVVGVPAKPLVRRKKK